MGKHTVFPILHSARVDCKFLAPDFTRGRFTYSIKLIGKDTVNAVLPGIDSTSILP